jgi:type 1 glutamine amidotransferase/glucose/arabinose dehydrogenase
MLFALGLAMVQGFEPGISMRLYDIGVPLDTLAPLVPGQTPNIDRRIERIDLKEGEFGLKDNFLAELSGEFFAQSAGNYTFRLSSDDGSALAINGKEVVTNDGVHPVVAKQGSVTLKAGWHRIQIRFFEAVGGEALKLEYKNPTGDFRVADGTVLRCPANLTRVTAPGQKKVMGVGGARRPGNGMPLDKLNPAWKLIPIRPEGFQPQVGALAFLPNGSLLVANFKPNQGGEYLPQLADGKIYRMDGVLGDDPKPTVKVVAENLQEPLGLAVVDGRVYVSLRTEIAELMDANRDGVYEGRKTVAKAWTADNYHHFTFGLVHHDGFLFASLSTSITGGAPGINGPNPLYRGSTLKVDLRQEYDPEKPFQNCEFVTGGHRTPNGVSLGPNGLILTGENQGSWQPANKINVIEPGSFFGHYNNTTFKNAQYPNGGVMGAFDQPQVTPPALYLPQNEVANSPSGMVAVPDGPFKGQILVGDVKFGGLRRAWLNQVNGRWEGGAVQSSQGFECGINRLAWGPDGCLYVGGIGATETWAWTDPKTGNWTTFGLQKIKPTGVTPFEIVRALPVNGGFEVEFTRPVKVPPVADLVAQQWNYEPTVEYGGDKKNREILKVSGVKALSPTKLRVSIAGLKEDRVIYLNLGVKSSAGEELWAQEVWYTLNRRLAAPTKPGPKVLVFSKTAGFRHDSIGAGVEAMKKLAAQKGFSVTHTEDANVFLSPELGSYDAVMFLSTTGDILNADQEAAFERFIRSGKGFLGVHSATDTEYEWPFYAGEVVCAQFKDHPPGVHQATIHVESKDYAWLPKPWKRVDEWYNFRANPRGKVEVLARLDESTYQGGSMGDHPIMWRREVGKGRSWYTALGHTSGTYREWLFMESIWRGIRWVTRR